MEMPPLLFINFSFFTWEYLKHKNFLESLLKFKSLFQLLFIVSLTCLESPWKRELQLKNCLDQTGLWHVSERLS